MPIKGARYAVKTTPSGKKVRLAFRDGKVVEAKNLKTGEAHTEKEFKHDEKMREAHAKAKKAMRKA